MLLGREPGRATQNDAGENHDEREPSPAERLFFALGQLYRRWYRGKLPVRPCDFDVMELARTIGVSRDIDMVTEALHGTALHFENEIIVAMPNRDFPWAVMATAEWARWTELEELSRAAGWDSIEPRSGRAD